MMNTRHLFLCSALVISGCSHAQPAATATSTTASAPPPEVASCATCHGAQGISQLINAPNLAGQPEIYLTEQMKAYRSGKRQNEVMGVIAKPLTDDQIAAAVKWYSSVKIAVVKE
jgi:cytochrome c553